MQTVSKFKRIRSSTRQAARGTGGTKEQGKERTVGFAADGFLNHRFLPLYREATYLPEKTKVEKGFFKSLSTLAALYGCELMDTQDKPYPYNILLAHWDATQQLNRQPQEISLHIIQDENGRVNLAARQVYGTGNTLYFIPVIPLYRLLQDKKQKQAGELLLSVCAYLYHIAGIPYYRDCYSAMEYYYDITKEWLSDDVGSYGAEDLNRNFSELYAAEYYGDTMHRKIFNRYHLGQFHNRLQRFGAKDSFGRACYQVAAAAYDLYQQYPDRAVFDNITRNEEYDEETIRAEQYISFIADTKGWLYENIEQMLNSEFNECSHMEEPTIVQVFDNNATEKKDLAFEYRLFEMITDLCDILNNLL